MAKKKQALVVEDSPTMRHLLVFALVKIKDMEVTEAENGVDGLKKLKERMYDIIVVDINMPLMDGFKLISMVRRDKKLSHIPIVIVTTEGAEEDRRRGLSLGANAYITKPIRSAEFSRKVEQLL